MTIKVKDESQRVIEEIWDLKERNRPLLKLMFDVRDYCKKEFNKDIVLTHIYRKDEEQDDIYMNHIDPEMVAKYLKRKFKSPHQFFHAFDLRSFIFTDEEIIQLVDYLNDKYNEMNYYRFTAKCHNAGSGSHFHIQFYQV